MTTSDGRAGFDPSPGASAPFFMTYWNAESLSGFTLPQLRVALDGYCKIARNANSADSQERLEEMIKLLFAEIASRPDS